MTVLAFTVLLRPRAFMFPCRSGKESKKKKTESKKHRKKGGFSYSEDATCLISPINESLSRRPGRTI